MKISFKSKALYFMCVSLVSTLSAADTSTDTRPLSVAFSNESDLDFWQMTEDHHGDISMQIIGASTTSNQMRLNKTFSFDGSYIDSDGNEAKYTIDWDVSYQDTDWDGSGVCCIRIDEGGDLSASNVIFTGFDRPCIKVEIDGTITSLDGVEFISNIVTQAYTGTSVWNYGTISTINDCDFIDNKNSYQSAGAIANSEADASIELISNCTFSGNSATGYGGAITNGTLGTYIWSSDYTYGAEIGSIVNCTFTDNYASWSGGAIWSDEYSYIENIEQCTFTSNQADEHGGAVYNVGTIETISESTFTLNQAGEHGGAVYNEGTIDTISYSTFTSNSAGYPGGAICNFSLINSIENSSFNENEAYGGGAIYNGGTIVSISDSSFTSNKGLTGDGNGGIYNDGTIGTISNTSFSYNEANSTGGAIYNRNLITLIEDSSFLGNKGSYGGAIYNYSIIGSIVGTSFESNSSYYGGALYNKTGTISLIDNASFLNNTATYYGGAIDNRASIEKISNSSFESNSAGYGGAIMNFSGTIYLENVSFIGNTATAFGGAIYNNTGAILSIIDSNSSTIFSNNKANGVSNAIYNDGTIYLGVEYDNLMSFNDSISGSSSSVIYINQDESYYGTISLNADMSDYTGSVVASQGTLDIGVDMGADGGTSSYYQTAYTNFFTGNVSFGSSSLDASAVLDAANGVMDCFDTTNWTTETVLEIFIDVSLIEQSADFFDLADDRLTVLITGIDILDELDTDELKIAVADASSGFSLDTDIEILTTDNYTYTVSELYEDETYYLVFSSSKLIPEPSSAALCLLATLGLMLRRRRL